MWYGIVVLCLNIITTLGGNYGPVKEDHWGYHNHNGPSDWASLYPICGGSHQSPVNIITENLMHTFIQPYNFHNYDQNVVQIKLTNSGHSVQVELLTEDPPYISGGGLTDDYILQQFHFHWGSSSSQGSEHTIDSARYPMEIHNVFYKASYGSYAEAKLHSDGVAVLGVFVAISTEDNPQLQNIVNWIPEVITPESHYVVEVDDLNLAALLPSTTHSFYWYRGSFTTPTCDEVVTWTVFKDPITMSETQLSVYRIIMDFDSLQMEDNFRPTQPLNDRLVYTSTLSEDGGYSGPGSISNKPGVNGGSLSNKPGINNGLDESTSNKFNV